MQTLVINVGSLLALPTLPFLPLPAAEAWLFLAISVVVHLLYFMVLVGAYRHGDLSQVYPISRGSAPLLVTAGAWLLAGESLGAWELAGVAAVSIGIMSLASPGRRARQDGEIKAVAYALLTGLTIAIYSLADGLGVRAAGHAFAYIAWLFVLSGPPLLAVTLWRRRGRLLEAFRPHLRHGAVGGALAALAYGIVIWAMSAAPLALIVSLRETSVLIAAGIGALVLKESFGPRRLAATAIIVAGAALINLGG
jgi:drug/metabolite transporter (DMT)-like permease